MHDKKRKRIPQFVKKLGAKNRAIIYKNKAPILKGIDLINIL